MRNLLKVQLLLCLVVAAILSSCSGGAEQDYVKVIPNDISGLVSVDISSILEKGDFNSAENKQYLKEMIEQLGNETSSNAVAMLQKIVDEPSESGLDLTQQIYLFSKVEDEKLNNVPMNMVAKMGDTAKFRQFVDMIVSEEQLNSVVDLDDFSYTQTADGELTIAYNQSVALIAYTFGRVEENSLDVVKAMINQPDDSNIYANSGFKKLNEYDGDVKFLFEAGNVPENILLKCNMNNIPSGVDITKLGLIATISFDKGEVNMMYGLYSTEPDGELPIEMKGKPMNGKFLKTASAESLIVIGAGIDGEAALLNIQNQTKLYENLIKDEEFGDMIKAFVGSLDGDMHLSVGYDVEKDDFLVTFASDFKGDGAKIADDLLSHKEINKSVPVVKGDDGIYTFNTFLFNVKAGVKDGAYFITTSQDGYDALMNRPKESIWDLYPNSNNKLGYTFVNIESLMTIAKHFRLTVGIDKEIIALVESMKYAEVINLEDATVKLRIVLVDSNENSLKTISLLISELL